MKHIVYKTTCLVNNKIYIGVHKTENPDIFDGYLGNAIYKNQTYHIKHPTQAFHYAVRKYGVDNFVREVLFVFDDRKQALLKEAELVNKDFVKLDTNYNVALGGNGGCLVSNSGYIVHQFTLNGQYVCKYDSISDCSKIMEKSNTTINDAIKYKRACAGFLFSYSETIDVKEYKITEYNKYYIYDSKGNFIQGFDSNLEVVKFLDSDRANLNRAIKCNYKINGYFISTEKLDKIQVTVTKLSGKLNQYDLDGNYIQSFDTIKQAKETTGLKLASISAAVRKCGQCNGFYWTRTNTPTPTIVIKKHSNEIRKVAKYDFEGNLLEIFESVTAAEFVYPSVRSNLKDKSKSCHGFVFKYFE